MNDNITHMNLSDICAAIDLPEQTVVELVEYGIVNPRGKQPVEWTFDVTMVCIAKRASRLHRDLEMDWATVAMVVELLEEREQLQAENEALKQQLQRFLAE